MAVSFDPGSLMVVFKLVALWGPGIVDLFSRLIGTGRGERLDEDIARVMAMQPTQELEARVAAGELTEPWASRLRWLGTAAGVCDVVLAVIEIQVGQAPGSVPDGVDIDAEMARARAAGAAAAAAYETGKAALVAHDDAGYAAALAEIGVAFAAIARVKARICPVMHKKGSQ